MQRPCPGPEVLGSKIVPHRLMDVLVDHTGIDIMPGPVTVIIFKKVPARYLPALTHHVGQPFIVEPDIMMHPLLARKRKDKRISRNGNMLVPERGETI
jgi:hypothetical protein